MSFNFFPTGYQPKYDLTTTYQYISKYSQYLTNHLTHKLNTIMVGPITTTSAFISWNVYGKNERYVSFDNAHTMDINQFINDPRGHLKHIFHNLEDNKAVAIHAPRLIRDIDEHNEIAMVNDCFYIEYLLHEQSKNITDQINQTIKMFLSVIHDINKQTKLDGQQFNYIKNLHVINIERLHKLYPLLKIKDAITHYVINNGPTIVLGLCQHPQAKMVVYDIAPAIDDYEHTALLFVFNKVTNTIILLMKCTPTMDVAKTKQQLFNEMPQVLKDQIYDKTLLSENQSSKQSLSITIYFSNLMLINLSKHHLCEVAHTEWNEDFLKYLKANKVKYF